MYSYLPEIELRNDHGYLKHLNSIDKSFRFGIKGPTELTRLKFYSVSKSTQIDYMHSVAYGVVKKLFEYWFEKTDPDFKFSLKRLSDEIETRLKKIRPPSYIPSASKALKDWKFWKAKDFIHFILFYSVPLFFDIMSTEQFNHMYKLVLALEILLEKRINIAQIDLADSLLNDFISNAANIYDKNIMKSGFHELLHLSQCTKEIGPLNSVSCFPYEEINRKVLRLIKGRDLMGEEFFKHFITVKALNMFSKNYFIENEKMRKFIIKHSVIKSGNRKSNVNDEYKLNSKLKTKIKDLALLSFVQRQNHKSEFFHKIEYKGVIYSIKKNTKFNNSFIKFQNKFGEVKLIYEMDREPFLICKLFEAKRMCFSYEIRPPTVSCYEIVATADHEFFVAQLKFCQKVFFFEINLDLSYVNVYKSHHLFN